MKRLLLAVALACALIVPAAAQSVLVTGTKVVDNSGTPLISGQWCLGASCLAVTSGSFSGTVAAGTGTVTIVNGSTTYLTIPSVTVGGAFFNWDTFLVSSTAIISGIGPPRIACTPGAVYSQTDGAQNRWQAIPQNGACVWNGLPNPGTPGTVAVGTVTTLSPGSLATIVNVGSQGAAVLNFGVPTGAAGPNCAVGSPPGTCVMGATAMQGVSAGTPVNLAGDPPGGAASASAAATQHYVDTSQAINASSLGCSVVAPDNLPCVSTMLAHPSGKIYYVPPGTYNVSACSPIQELASHFEIRGAAWAATTFNFTGAASSTAPTNTTGWWSSGSTTISSTVAPHINDSVLVYQTIAGLVLVAGIQPGTKVTGVSGTGPFTVSISLPTTAASGSAGSPVPVEFGWQCIFDLGADDINWFSIHDLGFSYSNLPQAPTSNALDYPATAILFNTAGIAPNGIHDFNLYNLYFSNGSRAIASTRSTIGTLGSLIWGGTFSNIVGAAGVAPGTIANLQGTAPFGMQGATIDVGANSGKGGGQTRLTFRQVYNRQTIMEPLMTVQRTSGLLLHNIESNSAQDVAYDFDNNPDMKGDGFHVEFHTAITSGHAVFQLFSSSGQFNNVDIESHICPSTLPAGNCNTTPAAPTILGLTDNGSVIGTLSTDNWSLIPYTDSLGYCSVSGTWSAGSTALTLTPNSCSPSITSGQPVTGQGIEPYTVVTVGAGPTYTLSLPPSVPGSSTNLVFSTYAAYTASLGSGAVAPGSSIRGSRGFNGPLLPGDPSNNLLLEAGNVFHSNPPFVVKEAASPTAPASFVYPSFLSLGTGSTTGIPAGDECAIDLKYAGTGTFPASQYREQALCHDSGAGGLSGFGVYESDTSVRGAESFVKTFGCDKVGNCAATGAMKASVTQITGTQNVSGCGLTSNVGGASAGKFASGTTGTCTVVITPGLTTTNGYFCRAYDQTTPANVINVTGSGTTFCTISGTTTTGDVIVWHAIAF
jgi:hypothetical protein